MTLTVTELVERSFTVTWSVGGIDLKTISALHRTLRSEEAFSFDELTGSLKGACVHVGVCTSQPVARVTSAQTVTNRIHTH